MLNEAVEAHEEGDFFALSMYDQSAAFDLVNHPIFLQKIELLGFSNTAIQWYISFLINGVQYVHIDGKDSIK